MDSSRHAEDVLPEADEVRQRANEHATQSIELFLDNPGLYRRGDAVELIIDELGVNPIEAEQALSSLVGDIVDPVQNVPHPDGNYVGVIEYHEYTDEGAYGYIHYSDRFGERKRAVCARCVEQCDHDKNVSHATEGQGTVPDGAGWQTLLNRLEAHYDDEHEQEPADIEPGASLVSATTINGNQAWHSGNVSGGTNISISSKQIKVTNQGPNGSIDADKVDGNHAADL